MPTQEIVVYLLKNCLHELHVKRREALLKAVTGLAGIPQGLSPIYAPIGFGRGYIKVFFTGAIVYYCPCKYLLKVQA